MPIQHKALFVHLKICYSCTWKKEEIQITFLYIYIDYVYFFTEIQFDYNLLYKLIGLKYLLNPVVTKHSATELKLATKNHGVNEKIMNLPDSNFQYKTVSCPPWIATESIVL